MLKMRRRLRRMRLQIYRRKTTRRRCKLCVKVQVKGGHGTADLLSSRLPCKCNSENILSSLKISTEDTLVSTQFRKDPVFIGNLNSGYFSLNSAVIILFHSSSLLQCRYSNIYISISIYSKRHIIV